MVSRILLVTLSVIYAVRFAIPALFGASGASVFGEPWLAPGGEVTAFLDSDIRFFGVMCATLGLLFLVMSFDIKRYLHILDILMVGVIVGAVVRTGELATGHALPMPALIATGVEWIFPLAFWASTSALRKARRVRLEESVIVDAPHATVWHLFADFGAVHDWHPYMESASLDSGAPGEGVGAARTCEFGPKMAIRETVTEWDPGGGMTIAIDFLKGIAPPIDEVRAAVRVEPTGEATCRLVLKMAYKPRFGPLGGLLGELFINPQYRGVFAGMLAAVKLKAETGATAGPIVMPMSGRRLSAG